MNLQRRWKNQYGEGTHGDARPRGLVQPLDLDGLMQLQGVRPLSVAELERIETLLHRCLCRRRHCIRLSSDTVLQLVHASREWLS